MTQLIVAYALLVTGTPLLVVGIASAAAARATAPVPLARTPKRWQRRLRIATAVSWAAFAAWLSLDAQAASEGSPRAMPGLAALAAFAILGLAFGLPALAEVAGAAEDIVRARQDGALEKVRQASLRPRRVSDYLPLPLQVVPFAVALATLFLLAVHLAQPAVGERRLLLPVAFGLISLVFAGPYGAWIREEVCGPDASGPDAADSLRDGELGPSIRRIFIAQVGIVTAFSALALVLEGVDWASRSGAMVGVAAGLLGGAIGVVGCAHVLASGLTRRRLEASTRRMLR
jgi:hypothetical protein